VARGGYSLTWNGPAVLEKARRGAVRGLTEVDQRIEAEAKQELYPGHGLLTGTLRRSIVGEDATEAGPTTVRGRVATKGVRYARVIHRRYRYLRNGYEKVKPRFSEIVSRAIKAELSS
jgi:hypothetical protein